MSRPLATRVLRLERARSPACPACGRGGAGPATYEVVVPEAAATLADAPRPRPPSACRNCGRASHFWIALPPPRGE